jgi:thioredoxin 1
MGKYIDITDENFDSEVLKSDIPVLVDFWASWCAPCRMIAPIIEQIAEEYDGKLKVAKMDVDASPETPAKLAITGIPTIVIFKNGEAVEKIVGAVPKNKIKELVDSLV